LSTTDNSNSDENRHSPSLFIHRYSDELMNEEKLFACG
jgi:hypothetical protein